MTGSLHTAKPGELREIALLCKKLGIPVTLTAPLPEEQDHPWNGKALCLEYRSGMRVSDLAHDIAHWIVASAKRRGHAYFKLDFTPFADREEARASMLGILIERHLEIGDWRATYEFHNWSDSATGALRRVLRDLKRKKLIKGLVPVCLED